METGTKAAAIMKYYGAFFQEVNISIEQKTFTTLYCDLVLQNCEPSNLKTLMLYLHVPVVDIISKVQNLLDKFGPTLLHLGIRKQNLILGDDPDLGKLLCNSRISKCKKLTSLSLSLQKAHITGIESF